MATTRPVVPLAAPQIPWSTLTTLAAATLLQAREDILHPCGVSRTQLAAIRFDAMAWMGGCFDLPPDNDNPLADFTYTCELLGLDPSAVRASVWAEAQRGGNGRLHHRRRHEYLAGARKGRI